MRIYERIYRRLGDNWRKFLREVRGRSEEDDRSLIFYDLFEQTLASFGVEISAKDRDRLLLAFPGRDVGGRKSINISRLYDQRYN